MRRLDAFIFRGKSARFRPRGKPGSAALAACSLLDVTAPLAQIKAKSIGSMRKTTSFSLAFLAALALCGGCGQSASDASKSSSSGVSNVSSQAASPPKDQKICFQCLGQGFVVCRTGCVAGKQECPGPCMKLTRGAWIHMNVAGHDASELWQKFPNASGVSAGTNGSQICRSRTGSTFQL